MPSATARRAADHPPVQLLGRLGLVGYAALNFLVAALAAKVAMGDSAEPGKAGALGEIARNPFGDALLWALTVTLAALALWQGAEAIGGSVLRRRLQAAGEGIVFAALAVIAGRIAAGREAASNEQQHELTASALELPGGPLLVGAAGIGLDVVAAYVIKRGLTKQFLEDLDLSRATAGVRRLVERLGQVGWTAIGVAYGAVGALIVVAAVRHDPKKATGLDTALHELAAEPYGALMIWAIAVGVACFGAYCVADARYRR